MIIETAASRSPPPSRHPAEALTTDEAPHLLARFLHDAALRALRNVRTTRASCTVARGGEDAISRLSFEAHQRNVLAA